MTSSSASLAFESPTIIGTVKGPGQSGNQYVFITADNRHVKIGEFVYYEVQDTETRPRGDNAVQTAKPGLQILGKISERRLIDHLPDRIFADTEISPDEIAALVGFAYPNPEIYEVAVDV
ncbi:MAG: ATPase, partial [Leptolyngbyaceae bacterium]|nr:ATPase [Leptolyngbyaceae bacterium]